MLQQVYEEWAKKESDEKERKHKAVMAGVERVRLERTGQITTPYIMKPGAAKVADFSLKEGEQDIQVEIQTKDGTSMVNVDELLKPKKRENRHKKAEDEGEA
jgi:uncharacterized membrane protein YheB (UPF0754 family)